MDKRERGRGQGSSERGGGAESPNDSVIFARYVLSGASWLGTGFRPHHEAIERDVVDDHEGRRVALRRQ